MQTGLCPLAKRELPGQRCQRQCPQRQPRAQRHNRKPPFPRGSPGFWGTCAAKGPPLFLLRQVPPCSARASHAAGSPESWARVDPGLGLPACLE